MKRLVLLALMGLSGSVWAAYEIGEELQSESFWKADPVLFVRKHVQEGLQFTSDERASADSRQDGAVTCFGVPVFETKVEFAEAGGIARVELMLFNNGGTEAVREIELEGGKKMRRLERVDRKLSREEFFDVLKKVRAKFSKSGKAPKAEDVGVRKSSDVFQKAQTFPVSPISTQAVLSWNYRQQGKAVATFDPQFIRLAVDGPSRVATSVSRRGRRGKAAGAESKSNIADNLVRDPRGDVFIDNLPMVDQGMKGYCAVATAERVLRYYGVQVDEHELAAAAGTSAEGGTSTVEMKKSVEAIGRKYRLGTVVCFGDFEKSVQERIAGLGDEVKAYNKMAKKLKKPEIAESVYVKHEGDMTIFSPQAVDEAMDVEVRKEMKVNGMQKAKFTKFQKDIHDQIAKGIPLFWGVQLGIYPEAGIPQTAGGHMRLIIGYNDKKREILYTDSWGAGHELKRMPADWAWTISNCLIYMKPLK